MVQQATTRLSGALSFWLLALVYVVLGLLEVEHTALRMQGMSNREAARILIESSIAMAAKFRTYMLVRMQMSALTGTLVWLIASFTGLQFAKNGACSLSSQLHPFIGPFFATVCPTFELLPDAGPV